MNEQGRNNVSAEKMNIKREQHDGAFSPTKPYLESRADPPSPKRQGSLTCVESKELPCCADGTSLRGAGGLLINKGGPGPCQAYPWERLGTTLGKAHGSARVVNPGNSKILVLYLQMRINISQCSSRRKERTDKTRRTLIMKKGKSPASNRFKPLASPEPHCFFGSANLFIRSCQRYMSLFHHLQKEELQFMYSNDTCLPLPGTKVEGWDLVNLPRGRSSTSRLKSRMGDHPSVAEVAASVLQIYVDE
ncbi:hypothetical protein Syun_025526 [Stephania yunnanensis]|uniref:Uncharacterized protein n=1 Tax=Stephania yunnanensis TaxID=152371 RepID=A0AAP0ERU1_9MAGN